MGGANCRVPRPGKEARPRDGHQLEGAEQLNKIAMCGVVGRERYKGQPHRPLR